MLTKETFKDMRDGDYFLSLGKVNEGEYQGYKFSNRKLNFITIADGAVKASATSVKTVVVDTFELEKLECGQKIYIFYDRFGKVCAVNPV